MSEFLGAIILGLSFGSVYALLSVGSCSRTGRRASSTWRSGRPAFFVGRGLLRHARHASLADVRSRLLFSVGIVAPGVGLAPRPGAVPVPPHRERDRQARVGARPARRDPADGVPVVRVRTRSRTRSASCRTASHTYNPFAQRVREPRRPRRSSITGVVVFVALDAVVPLHRARPAHAGGRGEPADDRARRRRTPTA